MKRGVPPATTPCCCRISVVRCAAARSVRTIRGLVASLIRCRGRASVSPARGTLGNLGQASILAPGTWQVDVALTRAFQFRESQKMEFRAEAFNVTNSVRLNDPVTNFNAGNFGQITSAQDPRIMQFALKY